MTDLQAATSPTETAPSTEPQRPLLIPFLLASVAVLGAVTVLLIMAVTGVFSDSSRGGSGPGSGLAPATVDAEPPSPPPSSAPAAPGPLAFFADMLATPGGGMFGYGNEPSLLSLGQSVCDAFGRGGSRTQILSILMDPSHMRMDSLKAEYFVTASIRDLCPQYLAQ